MSLILILLIAVVVLAVIGAAVIGFVFQLLWWALIGLVIGALARIVISGPQGIGLLATSLFGIGGALLGGLIARALDVGTILEFIIAVLVAAALIAAFGGRRGGELVRTGDRRL